MGACIDRYGQGVALQMMATIGVVLVVVFLGLLIYFRIRSPSQPRLIRTSR
jgi:heme A synthase